MKKFGYQSPVVRLKIFEENDIVTASIDVDGERVAGVDGSTFKSWWGANE